MRYAIHEIYASYQGEGQNSGTAAVFCRTRACNLWSGREKDRKNAQCRFCDTQFHGPFGSHGRMFQNADELVKTITTCWNKTHKNKHQPYIILTGGEPMLQVKQDLIDTLHDHHCRIAIETNGTYAVPETIDWICVSPKAGTTIRQKHGDELKIVWPQAYTQKDLETMAQWQFRHFFLQPMDNEQKMTNMAKTMKICAQTPPWRLSMQTHKILAIP